jgi:hypothetical protein
MSVSLEMFAALTDNKLLSESSPWAFCGNYANDQGSVLSHTVEKLEIIGNNISASPEIK